jgi:hypothetical protein
MIMLSFGFYKCNSICIGVSFNYLLHGTPRVAALIIGTRKSAALDRLFTVFSPVPTIVVCDTLSATNFSGRAAGGHGCSSSGSSMLVSRGSYEVVVLLKAEPWKTSQLSGQIKLARHSDFIRENQGNWIRHHAS